MNEKEFLSHLNLLIKLTENFIEIEKDETDRVYWKGIQMGIKSAWYLIIYDKPPETFEELENCTIDKSKIQ